MDRESFEFTVYMIHACANAWDKYPSEVYNLLQQANCIDRYLVPYYDVLHTLGTNYTVDDIAEYMRIRGKKVYDSISWFSCRDGKTRCLPFSLRS